MAPPRKFDQATEATIAALYVAGETLQDIGNQFGLCGEGVRKILLRQGIDRRRHGSRPLRQRQAPASRTCGLCKRTRPIDEFYRNHRRDNSALSYQYVCRDCSHLRRNLAHYHLKIDDYYRIVALQEGRCAICQSRFGRYLRGKKTRLFIDHDHATGLVRGLLCSECNFLIARVQDDPYLLQSAIDYLAEPPGQVVADHPSLFIHAALEKEPTKK